MIFVEISPGEYFDRLTILRIKSRRITDGAKLAHVNAELSQLTESGRATSSDASTDGLARELEQVNERLWQVEDDLRDCERRRQFDDGFVELARSVYVLNDRRAALKRAINVHLGSALVEEKSYASYGEVAPSHVRAA
jgi:uncharacterized protein DUF6165